MTNLGRDQQDPVQCGLCHTPGVELVDSHIFPQWMGKVIRNDGPLISIPTHCGADPKFVQRNGDYDQIVCSDCESSFGPADDYFSRFYRARDQAAIHSNGRTKAYEYQRWNQAKIQRFVLTCLFRSHLSARPPYRRVELGPHADRLRQILRNPVAGVVPGYDVALMRETHAMTDAIIVPHRIQMDGNSVWRMSFVGFGAMVRMRHPHLDSPLANVRLGKYPSLWMVELSSVHKDVLKAMAKAEALHGTRIDRMLKAPDAKKS